jgi:hypothetical protein
VFPAVPAPLVGAGTVVVTAGRVVLLAMFVWSVRPNITKMPMMTARAKAPPMIQPV